MQYASDDQIKRMTQMMLWNAKFDLVRTEQAGYHDIRLNLNIPYKFIRTGYFTNILRENNNVPDYMALRRKLDIDINQVPCDFHSDRKAIIQMQLLKSIGIKLYIEHHVDDIEVLDNCPISLIDGVKSNFFAKQDASNSSCSKVSATLCGVGARK